MKIAAIDQRHLVSNSLSQPGLIVDTIFKKITKIKDEIFDYQKAIAENRTQEIFPYFTGGCFLVSSYFYGSKLAMLTKKHQQLQLNVNNSLVVDGGQRAQIVKLRLLSNGILLAGTLARITKISLEVLFQVSFARSGLLVSYFFCEIAGQTVHLINKIKEIVHLRAARSTVEHQMYNHKYKSKLLAIAFSIMSIVSTTLSIVYTLFAFSNAPIAICALMACGALWCIQYLHRQNHPVQSLTV